MRSQAHRVDRRLDCTDPCMQKMTPLQAVVIGGTGACGKHLVSSLLQSKDAVSKVTMLNRRRLEELPGVDVKTEESHGRLLQHIEDLDAISDDAFRQLCTGVHVFFNTFGTTRSIAGSAVKEPPPSSPQQTAED